MNKDKQTLEDVIGELLIEYISIFFENIANKNCGLPLKPLPEKGTLIVALGQAVRDFIREKLPEEKFKVCSNLTCPSCLKERQYNHALVDVRQALLGEANGK